MLDYNSYFQKNIDHLKDEGNYRYFANIKKSHGRYPKAVFIDDSGLEKEITIWCSNDYLGMSQNKDVIDSLSATAQEVGVGSGGTRNLSGNTNYHVKLEEELAKLHDKESSISFISAYVANQTSLAVLGKILPNLVFFSDELNHASIIQGIRSSNCEKHIFKHNDISHLEEQLQSVDINRPKIIVFESVYSITGEFSKIKEICNLAKKYNALTYLDEVHAVGLYGETGGGLAQELGKNNQIDIINGTLAKAFGVVGGYIAGKKNIIDCIRSFGSGFIFTSSTPPAICNTAITAIKILKNSDYLRFKHRKQVQKTKDALRNANIKFRENQSHIIPVVIGNAKKCREITDQLLKEHNIYVQPVNYPTVPKGQECLRITPSPQHNEEHIKKLVNALKEVLLDNNSSKITKLSSK